MRPPRPCARRARSSTISTAWHLFSARTPIAVTRASYVAFELPRPPRAQRVAHLRRVLGERAAEAGDAVERIAAQFVLGSDALERACLSMESGSGPLADGCGRRAGAGAPAARRRRAADRADAGWDDLVLPADAARDAAASSRPTSGIARRSTSDWGFGAQGARGLGISALFAGASGTGKTMAAEVLARELALDLYRDRPLAGRQQVHRRDREEPAPRLRRRRGGRRDPAVRRGRRAVRQAHARSRTATTATRTSRSATCCSAWRRYRGLAILATNQREAIDSAFLRRLRFIVRFPFPDARARVALWRARFPRVRRCGHRRPTACAAAAARRQDPQHRAQRRVPRGRARRTDLDASRAVGVAQRVPRSSIHSRRSRSRAGRHDPLDRVHGARARRATSSRRSRSACSRPSPAPGCSSVRSQSASRRSGSGSAISVEKRVTGRETDRVLPHRARSMATCRRGGSPACTPLRVSDLVVLLVLAFLAFGRVGCFRVACCHGRPARFGVRYTHAHARLGFPMRWVGRPLVPVQLFEAAASAVLAAVGVVLLVHGAAPARPRRSSSSGTRWCDSRSSSCAATARVPTQPASARRSGSHSRRRRSSLPSIDRPPRSPRPSLSAPLPPSSRGGHARSHARCATRVTSTSSRPRSPC